MRPHDLPGEEWRPVPGWEGCYEVSNLGRLYSIRRPKAPKSDRLLKPQIVPTGHHWVQLKDPRIGFAVASIHGLVLAAFVGPRPDGLVVRHLNGDPADNRVANLAYGTASENQLDAVRHGTHVWAAKTHCPQGHPYDEKNTRFYQERRYCRACGLDRQRIRRARKRGLYIEAGPEPAHEEAA